ncbi:hypothetical protein B0H19DRAFT_1107195 [Mycena capillaripes]|nr:hypothetical protein B0H19DRAFT_1107195 [Mycena capillaripes]
MGGDSADFDTRLSEDLKQRVATIILENPGMSPAAAMQKAQDDLITNNPFRPPTHGCPVNDLPPELLAHIFQLGCKLDDEEDEFDDDYEDEGLDLEDEWETDEEGGEADEHVDADEDVRMGSPEKRKAPHRSSDGPAPPETDGEDSDSEDGEEGEEEEVEPYLPFQILVSHVCRHWREIALGTHTLWTTIRFVGHLNADKGRAWLQRSNGLPLDIFIDCTDMHNPEHDHHPDGDVPDPHVPGAFNDADLGYSVVLAFNPDTGTLTTSTTPGMPLGLETEPEPTEACVSLDDLKVILDMIIPHVGQWRIFEVSVNFYTYMYEVLSRLAQCPSAPLLEELGLYNYEETEIEESATFQPAHLATAFLPFHGVAPKVTHVAFWGVHIAWDESLSFLQGLREIELAYHTPDVRPSFETFRAIVDASPELGLLSLCFSGPTGDMEALEIPSLRTLVLCYLEQDFVKPFVAALRLPGLEELTLDLCDEDYTEFAKQLAGPARGQTRSLLAGLTTMKIANLMCNETAADLVMAQLDGLKRLHIKSDEHELFFKRLRKMKEMKEKVPMYCPKLESLKIEGMEGSEVRMLVAARKAAGVPLNQVFIGNLDFVNNKDEAWLRANVETFDFFEPSDSEEEVEIADGEEMDTDGD